MIYHKNGNLSEFRPTAAETEGTQIVIADRNKLARARLKKLCGALDFTNSVTEVDSLVALRAALDQNHVDLVLLGSGLNANAALDDAHVVRAGHPLPAPAIVKVTDTERPEDEMHPTERGVSACLALQDLSLDTLQDTARTALHISRQTPDRHRVPDFDRKARRTRDLKPIVGRIVQQVRRLQEMDCMDPLDTIDRLKQIEGSLKRLWAFMEILDDSTDPNEAAAPTVPAVRGQQSLLAASINARVPSERPAAKMVKPPSVFRRRPD
jgi:CheY-like chemotaxis protein